MTHLVKKSWMGRGASPGVAQGPAYPVRVDNDYRDVPKGRILLIRHATPHVLPALERALAAVSETGGVCNHLAVLARELGKPCVTGIAGVVDAIEYGEDLRVDGGRGVVESFSSASVGSPAAYSSRSTPSTVAGRGSGIVPLLQFGHFSASFECVYAEIDVETALRIAAIVALPRTLDLGSAWEFHIQGNQLRVEADALRSVMDALAERLENGLLRADQMLARYSALCEWPMWDTISDGQADAGLLAEGLRHYVDLNQLTWAAVLAKEPLAERYRRFLFEGLPNTDAAWLQDRFLDTIVTTGRSYILNVWADLQQGRGSACGDLPSSMSRGAGPNDANSRRNAAVSSIRSLLNQADSERMLKYLAALGDLVELAERKNTDVARFTCALFGVDSNRRAVSRRLGFPPESEGIDPRADLSVFERLVERLDDDKL